MFALDSGYLEMPRQLAHAERNKVTMQEPGTPAWAKSIIIGALGYFISPLDIIPDVMPVVGYTDDLGMLAAAITAVAAYITDNAKDQAKAKLAQWFGA